MAARAKTVSFAAGSPTVTLVDLRLLPRGPEARAMSSPFAILRTGLPFLFRDRFSPRTSSRDATRRPAEAVTHRLMQPRLCVLPPVTHRPRSRRETAPVGEDDATDAVSVRPYRHIPKRPFGLRLRLSFRRTTPTPVTFTPDQGVGDYVHTRSECEDVRMTKGENDAQAPYARLPGGWCRHDGADHSRVGAAPHVWDGDVPRG